MRLYIRKMNQILEHIFKQAKNKERQGQKAIFEMFSPKMLAIAQSYIGNLQDSEDVLMVAFYKAFIAIDSCKSAETFPYWLRKIVVNESISFIRKNKNIFYVDEDIPSDYQEETDEIIPVDVEQVLSEMPLGYKLIFNLAIFEDKKHSEIAEILNISEGTSKSQLSKAKKWLKNFILKQQKDEK